MIEPSQKTPIIIAHRGAQHIFPEHTLEGYKKAIALGADFIEPDLVMTKDGVLVSRHEPYISATTDVKDHPEFINRKTTKTVDGQQITDWFVSDFTLSELKTLRARQARPERDKSYDDQFEIPTFQEIIDLAKAHKTTSGNSVGIYPELKHPTFHKEIGVPMLNTFMKQLEASEFNSKEAPIFVQCFEVSTLQEIRRLSSVRSIQLIGASGISKEGTLIFTHPDGSYNAEGAPYDFHINGNEHTFEWFATERGMQYVATYADGIGPWKGFIIPYTTKDDNSPNVLPATDFVTLAHKNGLEVHPYTFRDEDVQWQEGSGKNEYDLFRAAGIDGLFTDNVEVALKALETSL